MSETPQIFEALKPELAPEIANLGLGDILLGYQQKSIKALLLNSVVVIEKSRRIGLTWGLASHAALTASTMRTDGGQDVYYMGYEKEMAREFIDVVGMWAKAFAIAASDAEEFVFGKDDADQEIKAFRVTFASGFEVVALPSKPRAFRGKQGLVILDEAAFMDDVQDTIDAAMALLIWGGSVVIVSTHYGIDNPFNKLCDEIRADEDKAEKDRTGYSLITITFDDAIADGLYERVKLVSRKPILPKLEWIADIRRKMGEAAAQELDCIPSQGGGSWITRESLTACEHPEAGIPSLYTQGISYIGQDVARRRDFSVIASGELCGQILWIREIWTGVGISFADQYAEFDRQMARYRIAAGRIDQTGMGEAVVERHQEKHGSVRIQGRILSGPERLNLATKLRDRIEAGTIRIPHSSEIRSDLLALKRAGKEGKALMETKEKHPDIFWALALMCDAADIGPQLYDYTAARADNDDDFEDGFGNRFGSRFGKAQGATTKHGFARGAF